MGQAAQQSEGAHQPDALHTASLSTGAATPARSTAAGAGGARDGQPNRGVSATPQVSLLPTRCAAPLLSPPRLAALLVALMIVWATLGHRFAASTRYVGEGSAACLLGLAVGLLLVVARRLFHPEVLQGMLSFDPANFFV